jgi:methyltransferase-like protein
MTIEYRFGRLNTVMNALRRKEQLVVLEEEDKLPTSGGSQIHVLEELHENIKEGLEHDHTTKNIMKKCEGLKNMEVLAM